MATSGIQKWQKYFAKNDVVTTTKVETMMRLDGGGTVMLSAGTDIVAKAISDYKPQIPVTVIGNGPHAGKSGVVKFVDVQKPINSARAAGVGGGHKLQVRHFELTGKTYKIDQFIQKTMDAIEERDDLDADLKTYLQHLVGYYGGIDQTKYSKNSVAAAFTNGVEANMAEVEKDFGEIICGIATAKNWSGTFVDEVGGRKKFGSAATLFFPTAQNQSVYDFVIEDNVHGKVFVSAKSGSQTNTLSPNDAIDLIKKRGRGLYGQYRQKKAFKVLEALADGNVITGPIFAAVEIGLLSPNVAKFAKRGSWGRAHAERRMLLPMEIYNECEAFVQDHGTPATKKYLAKNPLNLAVLVATIENYLTTLSKRDSEYNMDGVFNEAIAGEVVFSWFDSISRTTPEGKFHTMDAIKGTYLRSKNNAGTAGGRPRFADKVGVQP